jgi:hypothetical protein
MYRSHSKRNDLKWEGVENFGLEGHKQTTLELWIIPCRCNHVRDAGVAIRIYTLEFLGCKC